MVVGVLVAAVAGVLAVYSPGPGTGLTSRQHTLGLASAKVFVDSSVSQISNVGAEASEVGSAHDIPGLMTRAQLLASLLSTQPLRNQIAANAGVPRDRLHVIAPTGFGAGTSSTTGDTVRVSTLDLSVDENLPFIVMNARAVDAATARRVTQGAVAALTAYVAETARKAAVPTGDRLVVSPMTPPKAETIVVGPRKLYGLAAFLFVLTSWLVAIVMVPRLVDYWRTLSREESSGAREAVS